MSIRGDRHYLTMALACICIANMHTVLRNKRMKDEDTKNQ